MTFAEKLKSWRGRLIRKEAAQLLGVSVRTYEAWEEGAHEPSGKPSIREIEQRMKETSRE